MSYERLLDRLAKDSGAFVVDYAVSSPRLTRRRGPRLRATRSGDRAWG